MKINFGTFKKRNIIIGKNNKMRPTQSMAKSIIFNILNIDETTKVLDLFAGTGSLGFESLSLGAGEVIWIDNNIESVKAIKSTITKLGLDSEKYKVFKSDFRAGLKKIFFQVDIIFLDPPFIAKDYYNQALNLIKKLKLLKNDGVIVLEKEHKLEINALSQYTIKVNKKIGKKDILFLIK